MAVCRTRAIEGVTRAGCRNAAGIPFIDTRGAGRGIAGVRAPDRLAINSDAYGLYVRGHFLFLRCAHGGSPEELLRSREYFERALALDERYAPAIAGLSNFYAVAARRELLKPFHATFAKAIEYSHHALALDPSLAIPHVHFGVEALYLKDES